MKIFKDITVIIITLLSILFNDVIAQQEPRPETKAYILDMLQNGDYYERNAVIGDATYMYNIPEVVPILEQTIWDQDKYLVYDYLVALDKYNSSNFIQLSHQFINVVDTLSVRANSFSLFDDLEMKVYVTADLMDRGDFTTVEYVFDLVENKKPDTFIGAANILEKIISNLPQYEEEAKSELLRLSYHDNNNESYNAIHSLTKHYGSETSPILADVFTNSSYRPSKALALDSLIKYEYPELENLMRSRLITDSSMTSTIAERLLVLYPTPYNYNFISNNIDQISSRRRLTISYLLQGFIPPPPDSSISIIGMLNNLINLTDTTYNYTWLGDITFKDELQTILQSAKTNLLAGDSLACATDVKAFQDGVDIVYKDSLNADPQFVTLEGWKFLYWNAQYILDRLPEIPITAGISTFSVFATHSVWLKQNCDILSGNVGVNEAGEGPFLDSQLELSVGKSTTTPAGYTIKGNRIKVKQNATVNADVYYNELTNNGTITGSLNTPLDLPLLTTLPEFKTSTPGTENIVVPQNGEYTLLPGAYGEIQVKKNGKLIFTGGEYNINNFNGGDNNELIFQSESEVLIKDKFKTGQGSYIGPEDTTTLSASKIVFYVEGINGNNGNLGATPKAAKVGLSNTVFANFYVPNGTLWLRQNSVVEGAFIGKDVIVGLSVQVKLKSAW